MGRMKALRQKTQEADAAADFRTVLVGKRFSTVLADPPWQFTNRTGKVAPEHRRLNRYATLTLDQICDLPVADFLEPAAHLYLWVPNALLPDGLRVLSAWGFTYKSNIVWHKLRKDGGSDGRGVGLPLPANLRPTSLARQQRTGGNSRTEYGGASEILAP